MKFTISGYSQRRAVEIGLTVTDLLILRWMADYFPTGKVIKYQIGKKMYFCVNYDKLLSDLPILGVKKDALYRRLKVLVMKDILEHETMKNEEGTFSLYRFGDEYESLLPYDYESTESHKGEKKKAQVKKKSYSTVFNDPENEHIKGALMRYIEALRGMNYTPKVTTVEKFAEVLKSESKGNPLIASRIVDQSISKGWKALYPLKDKQVGGVVSVPARKEDQAVDENGNPLVF